MISPCALLKHEEIKEYTTIWMDTVRGGQFGLSNTNKLVRFYDGTTGLKTGYTSAAGYCLSASAERGGMELVAVVLHCKTSVDRFESAKALLNYGFSGYALVTPQPEGGIPPVPVVLGRQDSITPVPERSEPLLLEKALASQVQTAVTVDESVQAPVEAGQRHNDRHGGRAAACRNSARRAGGRPRPHVSGALGGVFEKHLPVCLIIFDRGRALPCISGPRAGTHP